VRYFKYIAYNIRVLVGALLVVVLLLIKKIYNAILVYLH